VFVLTSYSTRYNRDGRVSESISYDTGITPSSRSFAILPTTQLLEKRHNGVRDDRRSSCTINSSLGSHVKYLEHTVVSCDQ
jgi:hypothetical protein